MEMSSKGLITQQKKKTKTKRRWWMEMKQKEKVNMIDENECDACRMWIEERNEK